MSTTSVTAPQSFTGVSQFASDFQSVLTRAVSIAQLPVTQLQTRDSTLLQQKALLGNLSSAVGDLTTSLKSLGTVAANQALGATSSNTALVTATANGATGAATYTINSITSIATAASERSTASYTDSASTQVSKGTFTLVVAGGAPQTFSLAGNDLNDLANGINALGAGVTASVVTTGGVSSLSVTAAAGPGSIRLYDGATPAGTDILTSTGTGTEQTNATFADPAATPVSKGAVTLVAGGHNYTISLASNNLVSLRDQINGLSAGVTASILTTGTGNYLSLSANTTGATTLKLYDGANPSGTNLLTNTNQGTDAKFNLNGIDVDQPGNVVNSVIPGVTFTLLGNTAATTAPITLTVASDATQLSSGLQDFVTNYNALMTQIKGQIGAAGGLLSGDTAVEQLQSLMRQMTSYYSPSGSVHSLADLGVTFDSTGVASFNQTTFSSLTSTQIADGFSFVGSATTGLGGFSTNFNGFSDPITGLIKIESDGIDNSDKSIQKQIATLTARITTMQTNLIRQLEQADAAQEALQSQQQLLSGTLQGLNLVLYGKSLAAS